MPLYLMSHPDKDGKTRERLVEAANIAGARNHIAKDLIQGEMVSKPAELFKLAQTHSLEKAGEAAPEAQGE